MRVDFPHVGPDDLFDQWIGSAVPSKHMRPTKGPNIIMRK